MVKNKGFEIEDKFREEFKGSSATHDFYDFETSDCLYEVKSCRLTLRCTDGNVRRPYVNHPHKYVETRQYGKFRVYGANHNAMIELAKMRKKKAKYIFAIYYKTKENCIYRIAEASILKIPDEEKWFSVPITQVFR